ncbi:hypothetical protein DE146DRAFT_703747 [Phaeosphaeria sp. MPI-PUGE-AT-0046c]|nr:hypothetical protein DE146DRAFT_703747 [Phaeosphaeria sp. MPI-PUGE-AT-0046c]
MTVGIAIIGSGIFAKEQHLPAVQAVPSLVTLKAIYSRSLKSAAALSENVSDVDLYSDDSEGKTFDDLLKRDDIKGVIIALPIPAQPDYIKKALGAGKHVLAEKPVAKDIATAQDLIAWTKDSSNTTATFCVAENFRFLDSFNYGSTQVASLGRILTFRTRIAAFVAGGSKYYETSWRKDPTHQGGFLLDGGVHFAASTRLLLAGAGEKIKSLSAFTAQMQEHLKPVDTMNAIMQLDGGASGTFAVSFGTTDKGSEYLVACEKGSVHVSMGKVTVKKGGEVVEEKEFKDEGAGVKQEVKAWAESLNSGEWRKEQSAEQALGDLEIIESALESGKSGGRKVDLKFQ